MKMIKHILKLAWNRKRGFTGILFEQALIMLFLTVFLTNIFGLLKRHRTPGVLDTRNTIVLGWNTLRNLNEGEDLVQARKNVIENIKRQPYILAVAQTKNLTPYFELFSRHTIDSLTIDNQRIGVHIKGSDEHGISVFRPVLEQGEWLLDRKLDNDTEPVVITRQLADRAGWDNALGKQITIGSRTHTVVGVVSGLKHAPFEDSPPAVVIPVYLFDPGEIIYAVRLKDSNAKDEFFLTVYHETKRLMALDLVEPVLIEIDSFKRLSVFQQTVGLIFFGIAIVFLTFFAFLGAFGLFMLYAQRNFKEYALRMALGSGRRKLIYTVVMEALVITFVAILPAFVVFLFAYSFAQITGFLVAASVMFLFSSISAWAPAWKVSKMNPAEALQYE